MIELKSTQCFQKSGVTSTIVHVLNGFAMGGNESLCLQITKFAPVNTEIYLINLDPQKVEMLDQFQAIMSEKNIICCPYQSENKLKFVFELRSLLSQISPDAVLVHPFGMHVFVSLAVKLAGLSSTVIVKAGNPAPQNQLEQRKWKNILRLSNLLGTPIHSCSESVQQSLVQLGPLPKKSFPIPNGCDIRGLSAAANLVRERRADPKKFVVGMVARLNQIKDHATLIQAFSQLPHTGQNLELWLIGDGEERSALEALAFQCDIVDQVKFLGSRPDIPNLLGQLDVFAFSTTAAEGFGIALIEAMAARLPIVASDVPACREVLDKGKAGELVAPHDPAALASALSELLKSSTKRQVLGQRGYERAISHYSIETCTESWYGSLFKG